MLGAFHLFFGLEAHALANQNQNQDQRYSCYKAFKSTSECACGILRGMKSVWTSPGMRVLRMAFPGGGKPIFFVFFD